MLKSPMLHRLDSLFLLGGGKRLKDCMVRIVPIYSAFWKRNDSTKYNNVPPTYRKCWFLKKTSRIVTTIIETRPFRNTWGFLNRPARSLSFAAP